MHTYETKNNKKQQEAIKSRSRDVKKKVREVS
jgi:hypothetical protein